MGDLRSIKWLRPLLVALFVSYYIGGTAFTHTHFYHTYFYQTQLITHSHPYWPNADGLPDHDPTGDAARIPNIPKRRRCTQRLYGQGDVSRRSTGSTPCPARLSK